MRSKVCEDGQRRILAKIEVPLTTDEIAVCAMCHPSLSEYANPLHGIEKLNKRQMFQLAKESIRTHGTHAPQAIVKKLWKTPHIEKVKIYVGLQFPECD
jgi:hypothetical protein